MKNPTNVMYSKSHEWVKIEGKTATIGLTDHAQSELGDLVFINLPAVGGAVKMDKAFTDVESVKAVSDVISPVTGKIVEVNEELEGSPELINNSPYEAWICRIEFTEVEELMTAAQYEQYIQK